MNWLRKNYGWTAKRHDYLLVIGVVGLLILAGILVMAYQLVV